MVLVLLADVLHTMHDEGAGLMDLQVTPEQHVVMDQLRRDILAWVDREITGRDETLREDVVALLERRCEEMNAQPLDMRLRVLAGMHGSDYESVRASVEDVTWSASLKGDDISIVANIVLKRQTEQVFFTVAVEPMEPIIDAHWLRCPAEECDWRWEIREGVERKRDISEGRVVYVSHHRKEHPLDLSDLEEDDASTD